jgi:hypothetical protein
VPLATGSSHRISPAVRVEGKALSATRGRARPAEGVRSRAVRDLTRRRQRHARACRPIANPGGTCVRGQLPRTPRVLFIATTTAMRAAISSRLPSQERMTWHGEPTVPVHPSSPSGKVMERPARDRGRASARARIGSCARYSGRQLGSRERPTRNRCVSADDGAGDAPQHLVRVETSVARRAASAVFVGPRAVILRRCGAHVRVPFSVREERILSHPAGSSAQQHPVRHQHVRRLLDGTAV